MTHQFWKGFLKQAGVTEVACIAVINGDKILLGKRRDNQKITSPGGHMDPGETPLEGAVRELYEETGIKADPKDLEHLTSKLIRKPDGKELKIHAFKLDEGKHKTTMSGDPDQEVFRWTWQKLPLSDEVSNNLHVQKENVLFDALGIKYGGKTKIMNGDHYAELQKKMAADGNPTGFMRALHEHFHVLDQVIPVVQSQEENGQAEAEPKEQPPEDPMAKHAATPIHRRLIRMAIRKSPHHPGHLAEDFAHRLAEHEVHHMRHTKEGPEA